MSKDLQKRSTVVRMMSALSMSKVECRQAFLQDNGETYDKIIVGAVVPRRGPEDDWQILLLKRAAHEHFYPNVFEIPGGKVEDSDATILDAVKREVREETGTEVEQVIGTIESFNYSVDRKAPAADETETTVKSMSLQLNFVCAVTHHNVKVNPEEHSEARFVIRSQIKELEMTESMRAVVEDGFVWFAEHTCSPIEEMKILSPSKS
ncbi:MAG: hypothetical protein Q9214_004541 [Letrouitia sp. 1 TL-2023]